MKVVWGKDSYMLLQGKEERSTSPMSKANDIWSQLSASFLHSLHPSYLWLTRHLLRLGSQHTSVKSILLPESILGTVPGEHSWGQGVHHASRQAVTHKAVESLPLFRGGIKEGVQKNAMESDVLKEYWHTWRQIWSLLNWTKTINQM